MSTDARIGRLDRSEAACIVLRLLLAGALLLPLAVTCGEALAGTWLAAYRAVFSWAADEFRLLDLGIDREGADRVLRARVAWQRIVVIGGKAIHPDPRGAADASTLLAHALQGPLVAVLAAIAWPAAMRRGAHGRTRIRPWVEWAARALALAPLLAVLVLIDVPLVLAGELWEVALDALDPGATSVLVAWKSFVQGGGRYALGLAAGLLAVLIARRACRLADRLLPAA